MVPDRLEQRVGEAEHEQVLHRLFAKVVVDAIDLPLAEVSVQHFVEGASRPKASAERFLHNEPAPARIFSAHAGLAQPRHNGRVQVR